ncbi:murein biosynthesis integral membrane protein [compost metagenome]
MYLRAGVFSLGLLLLSRVLGLLRESVQAAAFGSSGMGDVVIVMFTLPDLLVGIFLSGALAYVLLPHWAQQGVAEQNASQRKVAKILIAAGVVLGLVIWQLQDFLAQALAPGLKGDMKALGASSLAWSAVVLPLAMLAALWTTRLQHERDFIGMYAGNLLVNFVLVAALLLVAAGAMGAGATAGLGLFLVLAMLARLGWLGWRLRRGQVPAASPIKGAEEPGLPKASVWIWAGLSSGLLLLLPLVGRSIASQGGEGALASFNYAWKLVELPLVLAVQLVASLAFPAITRTEAGTPERERALQLAFSLAWALACAAVAVVATFSLPLAGLLFGWGRMGSDKLEIIAQWSAIGVWSLLPQALIAVLLTVMAISQRMHVAVWAYIAGLLALLMMGWAGAGEHDGAAKGAAVMWMLDAVLVGVALVLMVAERKSLRRTFPWLACLVPLLASLLLISLRPLFAALGLHLIMILCCVYGLLVVGSAVLASPLLRGLLFERLGRGSLPVKP